MADFYGRVKGNSGEGTRCGNYTSGIKSTAETWNSIIEVEQNGQFQGESYGIENAPERNVGMLTIKSKTGNAVLRNVIEADLIIEGHFDLQDEIAAVISAISNLNRRAVEIKIGKVN